MKSIRKEEKMSKGYLVHTYWLGLLTNNWLRLSTNIQTKESLKTFVEFSNLEI